MHTKSVKLLVYPLAPDNPYQTLLYDTLIANNLARVKMVKIPTTLPGFVFQIFTITFVLIAHRLEGYRIIHIHWLYQLGFPGKPVWPWMSRAITTVQVNLFLCITRILGYKIVWTVHDVVPHYHMSLNDTRLSQRLLNYSSKLIVLSSATIEKLDEYKLTYDLHKIAVIPHGNYIGSYPNTISKSAARSQLGITNDAIVYLFFGTVLPYKNASGMLEAFEEIVRRQPNSIMIIAGKASDPEQRAAIDSAQRRMSKNLKLYLDYIPDGDVQTYFNAADFVVFPYLRITNSGVALLAASFAKPVIAPLLGAFKDLPRESGIFYKAGDQERLKEAMLQASNSKDKLSEMGTAAIKYAQSLSWPSIADLTYETYKDAEK